MKRQGEGGDDGAGSVRRGAIHAGRGWRFRAMHWGFSLNPGERDASQKNESGNRAGTATVDSLLQDLQGAGMCGPLPVLRRIPGIERLNSLLHRCASGYTLGIGGGNESVFSQPYTLEETGYAIG